MEEQNQLDNFFSLSFDLSAREQVKKIALWAKITSILAFIGYILSLIIVIFTKKQVSVTTMTNADMTTTTTVSSSSIAGTIVVIIVGGIINYFLYRFAVAAAQGVEALDSIKLNEGLDNLRAYFKIIGILLLIVLVIVGLAVIIGVLSALTANH